MGNKPMGHQSFIFEAPPVVTTWASVAGKKEMEGPLANYFDYTSRDSYFGQKTWEQSEQKMQQLTLKILTKKSGLSVDVVMSTATISFPMISSNNLSV